MKFRTLLMAASAMTLMASPAFAQCPDDVAQLEREVRESNLAQDTAQRLRDRLAEARNAVQNDNVSQCEDIVADVRDELEDMDTEVHAGMNADADMRAETGVRTDARSLAQVETEAGEGTALIIRQDQPRVTVRQGEPEITIRQPAPEVTVRMPEPEVEVHMPEPQVQGNQQARVEVESAGEPEVSIERTGEPQIHYEGPGADRMAGAERNNGGLGFLGLGRDRDRVEMQERAETRTGADLDTDLEMQTRADVEMGADADILRVGDVKGRTARSVTGERIGEIENIVRSQETGEVFVIISSGGFLGLGESETAVPLSRVQLGADEATLDVAGRSELRTYDTYQRDRYIEVEEDLTLSVLQAQ